MLTSEGAAPMEHCRGQGSDDGALPWLRGWEVINVSGRLLAVGWRYGAR
jgi:hypothetical protein